jgi:hypothetical protein
MTTLVLPPRYTEDSIALSRAAGRLGWQVERLASWHIQPTLREEDVCLYGEPLFAIHASTHLGVRLIETPYNWLEDQPPEYLKRSIRLMTMREARAITDESFVKCAGEKFFAARVFQSGANLPSAEIVSDAVPVLVIEPVIWDVEFRCFVLDRKCVTLSPYLIGGELARTAEGEWKAEEAVLAEATGFIERVLRDERTKVPPAVVIDVGIIRDRGWALVEANPAWGSGIYGCDPATVLQVVRRSCVREGRVTDADRPWVIDHQSEDFV